MSDSNCCFLTCIQVSQDAGKVSWYSHLLRIFHSCDPHSQRLYCSQLSRIDFFFSCFFYDPEDVGNLTSGSSAFSKSSLYIWKFSVHILLKPSLKDFDLCLWESNNELISEFHSTSENYLKGKSHLYQCCENVVCNNCPVTFYSGDTNEK